MNECDDVEEMSEVPETLQDYVTHCLDQHISSRNNAPHQLYGIFYKGIRIKTWSGKTAFNTAGAAKLALYNCFKWGLRELVYHRVSKQPDVFEGMNLNLNGKLSLFREELLRQVEIRAITYN
jgi:hypothetical protein